MAAEQEQLTLEIATPTGLALSIECESMVAPSVDGEFGVFPGHLPLLAALRAGVVRYWIGGKENAAAVGPGFAEAGPEKVLLLTNSFALPGDVDGDAVREDLADAEQRLEARDKVEDSRGLDDLTHQEIARDIDWAHARLALLEAD